MFDYINKTLKENGINPLEKKTKVEKTAIEENSKEPVKNKINESQISYQEIDSLVETAIRETANNIIMESVVLSDSQKLEQTGAINKTPIKEEHMVSYMNETISPIMDICQTLTEDARLLEITKDPSKVRGVSLPVYEIALTLESARREALTEESVDFTLAVKENVEPTIIDLKAVANDYDKKMDEGEVEGDATELSDIVDDSIDTYDFGEETTEREEKSVNEGIDPMDVHQYEDFDDEMWEIGDGSEPSQDGMTKDDPDFDDAGDIEEYEGDPAGGDDTDFPDTMPMTEGEKLARFLFLGEDCEDPEPDFDDAGDIEEYEGETAGDPDDDVVNDSSEFEGGGTADEYIVGEQVAIAQKILGHIFHEYGITGKEKKAALVKEAIHYIFRYGIENLYPATTDVANLVVEQNNISEINDHMNASQIVEATQPELTEEQQASLYEKCEEYLIALSASDDVLRKHNITKKNVMESIKYVTSASLVERTRQAFRHRMFHFNEEVKANIPNNWVLVENNPKMNGIITVRMYVTEANEIKKACKELKENSPLYKPSWKKNVHNNDALTSACIFTEVVAQWSKIKEALYNGAPIESKYIALEAMSSVHEIYKNLASGVSDPSKIRSLIENHEFRLQNLKEKVILALKKLNK